MFIFHTSVLLLTMNCQIPLSDRRGSWRAWETSISINPLYKIRLVHTSDGSKVVSEVGIGRKFWSSVNRHDGSDGSRGGSGRKRNSSDPSVSDFVELPTPLTIPIFDLHWIVTLLPLPIPTPLPIPSLVWTSPNCLLLTNDTDSRGY